MVEVVLVVALVALGRAPATDDVIKGAEPVTGAGPTEDAVDVADAQSS